MPFYPTYWELIIAGDFWGFVRRALWAALNGQRRCEAGRSRLDYQEKIHLVRELMFNFLHLLNDPKETREARGLRTAEKFCGLRRCHSQKPC